MAREAIPLNARHLRLLSAGGASFDTYLSGQSFAVTDDGEVFGAAGIIPLWPGCGHGWAIIPRPTGTARLLWFTRQVQAFLNRLTGFRRVQTTVRADFTQGLAWACFLDFQPEGRLTAYDEQGHDHIMFARIYV